MFVVSSVTVMHFCLSVIGIYLMKFFFSFALLTCMCLNCRVAWIVL